MMLCRRDKKHHHPHHHATRSKTCFSSPWWQLPVVCFCISVVVVFYLRTTTTATTPTTTRPDDDGDDRHDDDNVDSQKIIIHQPLQQQQQHHHHGNDLPPLSPIIAVDWAFAGPTTYTFGNDKRPKLASAAAVQNVAQGANGAWFMTSVNGGVWRTNHLKDSSNSSSNNNNVPVHWEPVLDGQVSNVACSSMSALHVSATNPSTIYAGCGGATSSEQGHDWNVVNSGDWGGIMRSTDNGNSWHMLPGFPVNYYVTDILEVTNNVLVVAAQSHLYHRLDGGIWQSRDGGHFFLRVLPNTPTFSLMRLRLPKEESSTTADGDHGDGDGGMILATHAHLPGRTISLSVNGGRSFGRFIGLPFTRGAIPFYTCAALLGNGHLVVAALTRLPPDGSGAGLSNNTDSQIFISQHPIITTTSENLLEDLLLEQWKLLPQPTRLDEDSMPKDRMALLADPDLPDLLYVAGNAGALVWRVNTTSLEWIKMWDEPDVRDGSMPHADCRNFAWDFANERLLLVTDGGLFARTQPRRRAGGTWQSLNGNYSALELLSAHYEPYSDRYVMGAQDNCAIITKSHAMPQDAAYGFVDGDGAITLTDPYGERLFGTTQFLGVGTIDHDPTKKTRKRATHHRSNDDVDDDDDDDNCGGLCMVQGDKYIKIPLTKYFAKPSYFPYFVHPYTLHVQDPTRLRFWVNDTTTNTSSAIYEFCIPYSVQDTDDISPPTLVATTPPGAMILDFVSGGYAAGRADPSLLVAISSTHLYVHSKKQTAADNSTSAAAWAARPLPVSFADPVTLAYDDTNNGARILGPLTHARTVTMAVLKRDSRVVAVTGWPSIDVNTGDEAVFLTLNAGRTWINVTGNLREASGVVGKIRPGGLLLVDLWGPYRANEHVALLVGTSNGVCVTFVNINNNENEEETAKSRSSNFPPPPPYEWFRFGTLDEFPIVLTADVDYEPISNRLVAATFGRGIYVLKHARGKLLQAMHRAMGKGGAAREGWRNFSTQ